jgi:hypothetical protein
MPPTKTEPQIGETTDILVGGGVVETVTILDIDRENNFILGQKNPDMIAGPQASKGNRFRWPYNAGGNNEYQIDSEFIFFDDETGIFAVKYSG